jgi:3-hydroxybutyryl-CoA dehydrogenase
MTIALLADDTVFQSLIASAPQLEWVRVTDLSILVADEKIDAFLNFDTDAAFQNYGMAKIPVFINSVTTTLRGQGHQPMVVRLNGWNGFYQRNSWEVSGTLFPEHISVLDHLGKKVILLPDEPGFVSPRIIAMIINEACFACEEKVSSSDEIDIAMKLGTNYPKGPFEWLREIGVKEVRALLESLQFSDTRYRVSDYLLNYPAD